MFACAVAASDRCVTCEQTGDTDFRRSIASSVKSAPARPRSKVAKLKILSLPRVAKPDPPTTSADPRTPPRMSGPDTPAAEAEFGGGNFVALDGVSIADEQHLLVPHADDHFVARVFA
jgi:hypothetical protein